jgi:hypothetical protein
MNNRLLTVLLVAFLFAGLYRGPDNADGQPIYEPCSLYVYSNADRYFACPGGDGDRLDAAGLTITLVAKHGTGDPIPGILPSDMWLEPCNSSSANICWGTMGSNADSTTNAQGRTTFTRPISAGGCDSTGIRVAVLGVYAKNANDVCDNGCLPIRFLSSDLNLDLVVDLIDLSEFAKSYTSPPHEYIYCRDYNEDGVIDLVDLSLFSRHYLHQC